MVLARPVLQGLHWACSPATLGAWPDPPQLRCLRARRMAGQPERDRAGCCLLGLVVDSERPSVSYGGDVVRDPGRPWGHAALARRPADLPQEWQGQGPHALAVLDWLIGALPVLSPVPCTPPAAT